MAEQSSLFDLAPLPAAPPIWERFGRRGVTCGGRHYHHPSGCWVVHCGHPTANFPYYIETPAGESIYAPNGRGFQRLDLAKAHVEQLHKGTGQ